MFAVTYETWEAVCNMYFNQKDGRLKAYLQWFPFTKLTQNDKEYIVSKSFFDKYIASGAATLFPEFLLRTDNYLQKGDGSFRNSKLLSPLMYLLFQSIGKTISEKYQPERSPQISVFYSGNFDEMRCYYKQDYDSFYKEINAELENYDYFIKTDIREFFGNINLNKLFSRINKIVNAYSVYFTQHHLQLYKEIITYCGEGKFPLIENSVASSYLATLVYLDDIDVNLKDFIANRISNITEFKMIRYVDDLYILISSEEKLTGLNNTFNEIINEYSSLLKEYDLSLNTNKVCLKITGELNDELKKSLYDEYFNGIRCEIADLAPRSMIAFLDRIETEVLFDDITMEQYSQIITDSFSIEGTEFTPIEVFNYFVYENTAVLESTEAIDIVLRIINNNISIISLDPKRLTLLIMDTKSNSAIRALLNQLFARSRAGKWNSYDTTIAICYLIQGRFRHIDLLNVIKEYCPTLYDYYYYFCRQSFGTSLSDRRLNVFCDKVNPDKKAYYLYTMHLFELDKSNLMAAYAYYKNYFDRVTAHIAFQIGFDNSRKPNYKAFYKEGTIKKLYASVPRSDKIIETAHILRNANPLSHSSAELVDNQNSSADLRQAMEDLNKLILDCCKLNDLI